MIYQLSWKILPGLQGLSCSDFRAIATATPNNEQGVAVALASEAERDALLRQLEEHFGAQRFSNNAAAFEAVKSRVLEWVAAPRPSVSKKT
jgi:hypothetical protein